MDMGFEGFELFVAYAGDLLEFVDGGEVAVFGSPVEDSLGQDGTDAGKGLEVGEGCLVEVQWGGRGRATGE